MIDELLDESEDNARMDFFKDASDRFEPLPFHMDQRAQFVFLFQLIAVSFFVLFQIASLVGVIK
jgi:hypothetical protein